MENMTKKMKGMMNLRYSNNCLLSDICTELSQRKDRLGKLSRLGKFFLLTVCLLMASVGAWAQTYYVFYNSTYGYLVNNNGNLRTSTTFTGPSSVWIAPGSMSSTNRTVQSYSQTSRYLNGSAGNAVTLSTTSSNFQVRNNVLVIRSTNNYQVTTDNGTSFTATRNAKTTFTAYTVTINNVAQNNNGITAPSISCSGLSGSAGIQLSRTGVGGSYIPAHTTYAFNNQTIYYYNNTAYTNTNQFAVSVNANDATYNWSVTAGTANVSTTGVVTLGNNNTQNVTVRCRATINGVNKDATYTLNATATAALNETAYSDITITPSSQTLDLGETVTYTVSNSISQVTKTRPQYVTITDADGHSHYKVGTTYQAAEPAITETPGAAINFTSFNWNAAEGGAYFTLDPYYSASSNKVTLTRSAQKTATQQTFTISVTGVYGEQNKTASATVTIPATQVDLTALHAGAAINLGVGSSESINGHYTYEPNYDSAGAPYLKFKYTSANTSVAIVDASGKVTAVGPGQTTITITAVKLDGTDGVSCNITVNVAIDAPTISIDGSGNVTITHPVPGVQIRYTTNGTDPTATSGTVYNGSFKVTNEQTVKAVAVANGVASAVASQIYVTSGISGGKVILNDYMDHSWTLFQPTINGEDNPIYYANPKDVKITYKANGGAVSISESADQFVYYKTLTDDYKYTTIPNPFSKRPRANGNYQGFSKWKITRISGGTITGLAVNSEVNAETELTFNPTNEYGMEVDFEVVWTRAYVVTCAVDQVNANLNSNTLAGDSYETNFIVITSGTNSTANLTATTSKKVTITMVTPDGATDYRTGTRYIRPATVTLSNDWKFEYINMNNNNNGTTITANNHNLVLGRGISNTSATGVVAGTVRGVSAATNTNLNYHIRMESGRYTNVDATMQGNNTQFGGTQSIKMTVGCDYDRANNEDNSKLYITDRFYGGNSVYFTNAVNKSRETLRYTVKSGTIHTSTNMSTTVNGQFYFGIAGWTRYSGKRTLIIEGGNFHSISGGLDYDGNDGANSYAGIVTSQYANADDVMVEIQMRGGTVRGSIYGAAQFAAGKGIRKYVFTGGTINGWVAGGCNGTNTTGGQTYGSTQIYVGGNNRIVASNANPQINSSYGGNVFGAGSGIDGGTTVGQVNNSTLVVADQSIVGGNVFGGGNYGYVMTDNTANTGSTKIYVTGGTVRGKVFGGSNQQQGQRVNITMTGGIVEGGLYGGSNVTGTINQNVVINIVGGQVGTSTTPANINGGGLGTPTRVTGNVDLTIGGTTSKQPLIYGSVYGGSESGYVNGTAYSNTKHTYVTLNNGDIHGSLYGGGNGAAGDANVYGNVLVTVNGGSVSEAVYGCNNSRGAPQGPVDVVINGTDPAPEDGQYALKNVFGGGNAANYTYTVSNKVYPTVTVNNCENSIEYVYGGGNAATVPGTDVTIHGGNVIGNVFGGGYGADITTKGTKVTIDGGTILNVYGGSNSSGTITGGIAVNINEADDTSCPINIDNVFGGGNRAASAAGNITIGCATKIRNVYGGANQANVTSGNVNLLIEGGNIDNVFGGNNLEGNISGTITVTINENKTKYPCGMTVGNVYGGGNQAAYGSGTANYPVVNILNGHLTGSVFGGGLGATAVVNGNPQVTIGQATGKVTIAGDVYGGGDAGDVAGTPVVKIFKNCDNKIGNVYGGGNAADVTGTNVTVDGGTIGMVFGGGHGDKDANPQKEANVNGNVVLNITGGTINKVFAGSNSKGNITGTTGVTVNKTDGSCDLHITELYGGGNEAAGNAGTIKIQNTGGADEGIGTVYGGANNADINSDIVLNITGGNIGDIFGGNNNGGQVNGNITVDINWTGTGVNHVGNVYGGGNIASIDNGTPRTVTVNIPNAEVSGSVFGGGKGKEAVIVGSTNVNLGTWSNTTNAIVNVDVFGGGDLAAVEGDCNITIRDCGTQIFGDLYGGGNAAPVYSTNTTMWGGLVKGNVFGGGNGQDAGKNPYGAQVGYKRDDSTDGGSGVATTKIYGGTVGNWTTTDGVESCSDGTGGVFGGSNTNGNIRGGIALTLDQQTCTETGAENCTLKLREIYGAGNEAAYAGTGIAFDLGCVDYLTEIYGGAKAADLNADANLTITSGHFGKVFGGNNVSGKLNGSITVTVDETGCNPVVIDELYGGGNLAAYSVYGYDGTAPRTKEQYDALTDEQKVTEGLSTPRTDPVVNIISCTSIGTVFGGGYGESAVMVGNPTVNINQIKGIHAGTTPNGGTPIPDALGVIGAVFGGGNAAKVIGDTNVNVGTATTKVKHISGDDQTTEYDAGANITGNIYGGGNQADVTGKTNVIVGRE